jgi:hypothetical protein
MKRILLRCLVLLGLSTCLGLAANQLGARLPVTSTYTPSPLVEIHLAVCRPLLKNKIATFVDLRPHPQGPTIPGALTFAATQSPEILEQLKQSPDVITFGEDENDLDARELAARLSLQGVPHVVFLAEGWRGWKMAGYPLAL